MGSLYGGKRLCRHYKAKRPAGFYQAKNGVPNNLAACHTALVDGYVVEGHVPVEAVNKLLKERPDVKGIAVPGMPTGAPGTTGDRSPVEVYFFNGSDQIAFFDKF